MKKYLPVLLLVILIVPSVALASWWNPFTWKIFQKKEVIPSAQIEVQKTSEEKIGELQKQIDDLKVRQPSPTTPKTPVVKNPAKPIFSGTTTPVVTPIPTVDLYAKYRDANGKILTPEEFAKNAYAKCASQNKVTDNTNAVNSDGSINCITYIQSCQNEFGPGGIYSGEKDSNGNITCDCKSGYIISGDGKSCQVQQNNSNPDPYGVLYGTGIQYSPEQLNDIDCAYYGRNCPTIHVKIDN